MGTVPNLLPVAPSVDCIDVGLLGLERYGACYVVRGSQGTALVDVGTSLGVPSLLAGLAALGVRVEEVTHILCTHIHLDHAGAAGHLVELFPRAQVVIHSRSRRHLVDPARLLAGVAEAVGPLFPLYGEVRPVDARRILAGEGTCLELGAGIRLEAISTPGHSRDHLAFLAPHAGLLFCGDAAGVSLSGHRFLCPVTAPPAFDPQAMRDSLSVMHGLRPRHLCLAHFGRHDEPALVFDRLKEMLGRWEKLLQTEGHEVAGAAVLSANLPAPGTPHEDLWRHLAEMNRRGFLMGYGLAAD